MNDYEFFQVISSDGMVRITMDRPPLNIFHNPMMAEFNRLLDAEVTGCNLSAVVIGAAGKAFSAGVDVGDHTAEAVGEMIRQFHGIFRRLASTDALTIALVDGAALGGGCELACACDIVLASERAKFGQPEVQVGVFPPVAACLLPAQVGIRKAVELTAIGRTINATEAHRIGLASEVFETAQFGERVQAYLDDIAKLSRPVVRMAKRATVSAWRERYLTELEANERLYLEDLMQLSDAHEGIAAFLEKRAPNWKHE